MAAPLYQQPRNDTPLLGGLGVAADQKDPQITPSTVTATGPHDVLTIVSDDLECGRHHGERQRSCRELDDPRRR